MAELRERKRIRKRDGTEEFIKIYSTPEEVGVPRKKIKLKNGSFGYIGLTKLLGSPKASSKRIKIRDDIYAELKEIATLTGVVSYKATRDETSETVILNYSTEVLA